MLSGARRYDLSEGMGFDHIFGVAVAAGAVEMLRGGQYMRVRWVKAGEEGEQVGCKM